jgi:hypothetical protein
MPKALTAGETPDTLATSDDVRSILGELDDAKLLDILALRLNILDIEEASMWLSGDADVFGAGRQLRQINGESFGLR